MKTIEQFSAWLEEQKQVATPLGRVSVHPVGWTRLDLPDGGFEVRDEDGVLRLKYGVW